VGEEWLTMAFDLIVVGAGSANCVLPDSPPRVASSC
jgi:hypothetical protein